MDFPIHNLETAPEAAKPLLEGSIKAFGSIPNLHGELADAPEVLKTYNEAYASFAKSSFTPAEQQLIYLAINFENGCGYCMAGHTVLARGAKAPEDAVQAIRNGTPIADARLEALRTFVQAMVVERGHVGDAAVERFVAAGFTRQQVLEVIQAIAVKVISSYTNHVAHTPNDAFMAKTTWERPAAAAA